MCRRRMNKGELSEKEPAAETDDYKDSSRGNSLAGSRKELFGLVSDFDNQHRRVA